MAQQTSLMELLQWVRATLPMDLDTPRMIEEKIESLMEREKDTYTITPSEILIKHEDANEYHFHEVDRKWIIEAMEEYAHTRSGRLDVLAKLLGKVWYYGEWKWETPNERIMQMIMQELGYYPFKNEDEMIRETRVDEDLYKQAVDSVPLGSPRMPLCNESNSLNQ